MPHNPDIQPNEDVIQIKKLSDVSDQIKRRKLQRELLNTIRTSINTFNDAFRPRRDRLLEINAVYRNKSYLDKNKAGWQSRNFLPLPYAEVESRTSILHQALWGNRVSAPFTVIGQTPADNLFASSAESILNNTLSNRSIGFFQSSEDCIRSCVKYGLGVYRYGWVRRSESHLVRDVRRDREGKIIRDRKTMRPVYRYVMKTMKVNRPFIRSVDIVDHFGWDPTARTFDPWQCSFVFEKRTESKEEIYENELRGIYDKGSFDNLKKRDPHGVDELFQGDNKTPQIRQDEGVLDSPFVPLQDRYEVTDWYGWFDIDGDGLREFIKAVVILSNNQILSAETNVLFEYPFIDVPYSRSLHSMTSWGVIDPVLELSYAINEFHNQRSDAIKLKLNPQFLINVNTIFEDHAYVSAPGAFHPFSLNQGERLSDSGMRVLEFQNLEFLSTNEEDRLISVWREATGNLNIQESISNLDRTPASTLLGLINQFQATQQLVVNSILDRHGELGSRILKLIQLFGDEEFIIRTAGRKGLKFRQESLENILGNFDIHVTTSTFFNNKEIEIQQLIQLRPLWAQAPHIDLVEVDKAIIENILPKKVDLILKVEDEPLSFLDEILLFLYGQGESVKLSRQEDIGSLRVKLRRYSEFMDSQAFQMLDSESRSELERHIERITARLEELEAERLIQAQKAEAPFLRMTGSPQGNLQNEGSPNMRTIGNLIRPKPNNVPEAI